MVHDSLSQYTSHRTVSKFRNPKFSGSPRTRALTVDCEKLDLGNSAREEVCYCYSPTGSHIRSCHWYRNWWPRINFNGGVNMTIISRHFTAGSFGPIASPWLKLNTHCLRQM